MAGKRSPIEIFVTDVIHNRPVNKLIVDWRIEESAIANVIIAHFRSMGIFFCEPNQKKLLTGAIVFQLKNSPILLRMLQNASKNEESRRRKEILAG